MKAFVKAGIFIGALCASTAILAQTNLLTNGDFETGDGSGWTPWTNTAWATHSFQHLYSGTAVIHVPSFYPYAGTTSHEQSVQGNAVHGGLLQVVNLTPGHTYEVSGNWSCGIGGVVDSDPPQFAWFEVSMYDGAVGADIVDAAPNDGSRQFDKEIAKIGSDGQKTTFDWQLFSDTFTANSSQATLALKVGKIGDSDYIACHHDNLEIVDLIVEGRMGYGPILQVPVGGGAAMIGLALLMASAAFFMLRRGGTRGNMAAISALAIGALVAGLSGVRVLDDAWAGGVSLDNPSGGGVVVPIGDEVYMNTTGADLMIRSLRGPYCNSIGIPIFLDDRVLPADPYCEVGLILAPNEQCMTSYNPVCSINNI